MGNVYFPRGFSISKLTQSPFKVCNEVGRIMFKFSQHIIQHHIYAPLIRKSNITNLLTWKSSLGSTAQEIEVWWDWVNFVPPTLASPSRVSRLISGNNVHMKQVLDAFRCISVNVRFIIKPHSIVIDISGQSQYKIATFPHLEK